ncbi:MAG TPA: NUDIX hydrolase [Anaerolineae bacterium]|jgi:8-oxo-dGTP pyrophosphatase MutT (NUDIX family)
MNDPVYQKIYNPKLLSDLTRRFGPFRQHHVDLFVSTEGLLTLMGKMKKKSRRSEVVMIVPNTDGKIWLHTKAFYPAGTYRLMSGGLEGAERPDRAFARELAEETGFKIKIDRCLAVITYTLTNPDVTLPFVSYAFLTAPTDGYPHPTDPNEAITDFRAVPVDELAEVARQLRSLSGEFAGWGDFRAVAHEVVWEVLRA